MPQHRIIRIQKPFHAILRAALLSPFQLPTRYLARHAFLPAGVGEVVDGWMVGISVE